MSCRCCQPGGDDSSDEDVKEVEEEKDSVPLLVMSAIKHRVESLLPGEVRISGHQQETSEERNLCKVRVQSLVGGGITEIPAAYIRPLEERPQGALTLETIPVLDMSSANGCQREALRVAIGRACEEWGFFQVINHGVPLKVLESMRRDAREFLRLPMDEKLEYACKPGVIASEGYGSKMLVKDYQVLDWRDYVDLHTLPLSRRNPSNWPAVPSSFRETVLHYSNEMLFLAQQLLGLISESLDLPSSYIKDAIGEASQNISVNYYPLCPQPDLTLGLQAHSDLGAITILMQADMAGLQVRKDGDWIAVQPLQDALVVNLGDMMEVLTNGRYKSVEHQAIVNADRDRLSVATFLDPAKDQVLFPAPELVDDHHPLLYREVLFNDFIAAWYSKGPDGKRNIENLAIST